MANKTDQRESSSDTSAESEIHSNVNVQPVLSIVHLSEIANKSKQPGPGKSVNESLIEARAELKLVQTLIELQQKKIQLAQLTQNGLKVTPNMVITLMNANLNNSLLGFLNNPFTFPLVLVKKKTGKLHLCVDYKELNKNTTFDKYPLPSMNELLREVQPGKDVNIIDLQAAYWQVPVDSKKLRKE